MKSVAVLFLLIETSTAFWYSAVPVDCKWMHWEEVKCMRITDNDYKMLEKRAKIEAENGGKECNETEGTRMINHCSPSQYVASTVIETVGSLPGSPTPMNPIIIASASASSGACATTYRNPSSGVSMVSSTNCVTSRKRRTAENKIMSRTRRQFRGNITDTEHRDVLFVIDSSGSVGPENFRKEIALAKGLAEKFCGPVKIGEFATRVAVMTFDNTPHFHINFDHYFDKNNLLRAMDSIPYTGGMTCLIDALNAARTEMFTKAHGSRVGDPKYDGLVVLITDGCLNCFAANVEDELKKQETLFHDIGISIVNFMVGVNLSCVNTMRALSDGSRCYQVFDVKSWSALELIRSEIQDLRCINRWTKASVTCP